MKKIAGVAFALLLCAAAGAQGIADGKWWKRPRIARQLQLSADQGEQLEKIFARSKPNLIDLRADLEKKQLAYDEAMREEKIDRKAIEAKIEAREQARAALQKELTLMELDMKQVLKPEQRERLVRMREGARMRMQQRRRQLRDEAMENDGLEEPRATPRPSPKPR